MFRLSIPTAALLIVGSTIAAEPANLTLEEADSRLRHAYELARETNDSTLIDRVLGFRDLARRAFDRKDVAAAQRLIRDAEEAVGLEAGGKSMLGLPVGRADPRIRKRFEAIEEKLAAAMDGNDPSDVATIVGEYRKLLGQSAGVPEVRKRGEVAKPTPIKSEDVAATFLKIIEADPRALKALKSGVPDSTSTPRAYAAIVVGCLTIRPAIEKHFKDKLAEIDDVIRGSCKAMLALQVKAGHFKFPDLRTQNLLIGDAIENLIEKDADALQDGWVVKPFSDGMSQIDAAECGIALLQAGEAFKIAEWTQAGLAAANWSKNSPLVANFVHNAYSVSLLCAASKAKPDDKFGETAWRRFSMGVAPGQTPTGRLLDPRSARTSNHFVFIRTVQDLLKVMPKGMEFEVVSRAWKSAIGAVVEESDKLGAPITTHTVQELRRYCAIDTKPDSKLRLLLEESGAATFRRCTQGGRVRAAAPLPELAEVSRIWAK